MNGDLSIIAVHQGEFPNEAVKDVPLAEQQVVNNLLYLLWSHILILIINIGNVGVSVANIFIALQGFHLL